MQAVITPDLICDSLVLAVAGNERKDVPLRPSKIWTRIRSPRSSTRSSSKGKARLRDLCREGPHRPSTRHFESVSSAAIEDLNARVGRMSLESDLADIEHAIAPVPSVEELCNSMAHLTLSDPGYQAQGVYDTVETQKRFSTVEATTDREEEGTKVQNAPYQ